MTGWFYKNNLNYVIDNLGNEAGGHAVLINYMDRYNVGIQNSWGTSWGSKGMALIPNNVVFNQLMYCCYIENIYNQFI